MQLVIITGMSGAGKTVALQALEDAGYEAIDNLPLKFIPVLVSAEAAEERIAVSVDLRTRHFSAAKCEQLIQELIDIAGIKVTLIYLNSDNATLLRRYSETRRKHPMDDMNSVTESIEQERRRMQPLQEIADHIIDTANLKPADLRAAITQAVDATPDRLHITVMSFAYARGIPREADIVMDVRFLQNPHYIAELKPLTGREKAVQDYVKQDSSYAALWQSFIDLLAPLLPRYAQEGKHYLTIAFGCTGGQHRSVTLAETLYSWLQENGHDAHLTHREL